MWNRIKDIFSKKEKELIIEINDIYNSIPLTETKMLNDHSLLNKEESYKSSSRSNSITVNEVKDAIPDTLPLAKALHELIKGMGIEFTASSRITSALADYKAFANNRPAQTVFKTLVSDGIYKELLDETSNNPLNIMSKYVSKVVGTYGYQQELVESVICEVLLGIDKCSIESVETYISLSDSKKSLDSSIISNKKESSLIDSNAQKSLNYNHTYHLPSIDLLPKCKVYLPDEDALMNEKERIMWMLGGYGIVPFCIESYSGPRYSMYEIGMESKYLSKFTRNERDILLALGNNGCRIINPLPKKLAIGLEIPNGINDDTIISTHYLFNSQQYADTDVLLPIVLGIDARNECVMEDLAKLQHLLICGGVHQGKTTLLHQLIMSLLIKVEPLYFKLAILSEAYLEFQDFMSLPEDYFIEHEGSGKVISDQPSAYSLFERFTIEMEQRRRLMKMANAKTIEEYNKLFKNKKLNPTFGHRFLPHLICIVDEIHSFFQDNSWNDILTRFFELSFNTGVHCLFTTRYTNTSTITPLIRCHMPDRICFNIRLVNESKLVLDNNDATRLLNQGDMLVKMNGQTYRCQTALVDTQSLEPIIGYIKRKKSVGHGYLLPITVGTDYDSWQSTSSWANMGKLDPLLKDIARLIVASGVASTSAVQRRYEIGYNRAGRIMDQLEALGVIGPALGGRPRTVLIEPMVLEDLLDTLG